MNGAFTSRHMHGATQEQMIRRRDASGGEAAKLARIMNEPNPKPEEVTSYVRELEKKGHMPTEEARRLLASIPHDPAALRIWARNAFALVMHQGIHAHAAYPRQLYPSPQQASPAQQASPQQVPQQALPPQGAPPAPSNQ